MQIKLGKKKLVLFLANSDDILEDDLIKLLRGKNPSWTIKDCEEVASLLKQFGIQVFEIIKQMTADEITTAESQQQIQQQFGQLKIKLDDFTKRKGIIFR